MLIDEAFITVIGGHGGAGKVAFFPGFRTSPAGGDGGDGGAVYAKGHRQLVSLEKYTSQTKWEGERGEGGDNFRKHGHNGQDTFLLMPVGTLLRDAETGEEMELTEDGQTILLVKGGKGGHGNDFFKSSTNRAPKHAQPGMDGERRQLKLIMRMIADVGFIGLPNAGKSSLLNMLTAAQVKTAAYPFTTLTPNLGSYDGVIMADIPGLIEGASTGKGLGIKFLKHIEKVKMLVHCISSESENPEHDYAVIRKELEQFNPDLLKKKEIIVTTKTDLNPILFKKAVMGVSIYNEDSLKEFGDMLLNELESARN